MTSDQSSLLERCFDDDDEEEPCFLELELEEWCFDEDDPEGILTVFSRSLSVSEPD